MTVQDLSTEARTALTDLVIRGMSRGDVSPALAEAVAAGLALAKGSIVMPAPHAAEVVGGWLVINDGAQREQLLAAFHRFLPLNRGLRELCTAWQCLPGGGMNDHSDAAYDAGVRDRFDDVHEAIVPLLRRMAVGTPELAPYAGRLQLALDAFDGGAGQMLTSPIMDSYHTVWMHLHQHLLLRLGMSRAEDEALEESLVAGSAV